MLWDEASGTTQKMRSKEHAHDYRYFPEPDLTPLEFMTTASEVLSHRLSGTNRVIDHIFPSLKVLLVVRDFVRKLRPRSWKAKERERLLKEQGGGAPKP